MNNKTGHITLLLVLLLLHLYSLAPQLANSAITSSQQGPVDLMPVEIACNLPMLRSYLLKGRQKSTTEDPFLLCPKVSNNCCTKQDQQRIYHIVNDILPARLNEYDSKVKMALARIKNFHKRILDATPEMLGSARRRKFCQRQTRNVINFPFNNLYQNLIKEIDEMQTEMRSYYQSFFCILCDGGNHPFFEFGGRLRKITFDLSFCKEFLGNKVAILRGLNVDLVEYLVALQNLVDCTHYVRSYNLRFFDQEKVKLKDDVVQCLNFISSKSFLRYCRPICEKITVSKIIAPLQGDFEFMIDAANLFEKFYDFKETGNFISTRLRRFFRRFVVPGQTNRGKRTLRLTQDSHSSLSKSVKSNRKLNPGSHSTPLARIWEASEIKNQIKKIKRKSKKLRERKLISAEDNSLRTNSSPTLTQNGPLILEGLKDQIKTELSTLPVPQLQMQTKGSDEGVSLELQRLLQDTSQSDKSGLSASPKQVPALAVDPTLSSFYNLISIDEKTGSEEQIYDVQGQPIDFDVPLKTWSVGNGINPTKYDLNNFNLTTTHFYRMLYNFRVKEKADVNLEFFLADFSPENLEMYTEELKGVFKMDPKQFVLKIDTTQTPMSGGRILAKDNLLNP